MSWPRFISACLLAVVVAGTRSSLSEPSQPILGLEFKLTGLVVRKEARWVFLVKNEPQNRQRHLQLREGDKFEGLEIVRIDPARKAVRVRFEGAEGEMNFETHGIRSVTDPVQDGREFVQVHRKFVADHVRAHEERYKAAAATNAPTGKTTETPKP